MRPLSATLPIFGLSSECGAAIYTPGSVTQLGEKDEHIPWQVIEEATNTVKRWEQLASDPFRPICLMVNLTERCQLKCQYCFAEDNERNRRTDLDMPTALAAARLVIANCSERNLPFQLVVTGGGEPTLAQELLQEVVAQTKSLCQSKGVAWRSYIATNGCAPDSTLIWLARNIDEIGLSCDGPPDIHDAQRPTRAWKPSSPKVRHAARVLREKGANFSIRTTITQASLARQAEIVGWLWQEFQVQTIRFETVYHARPELRLAPRHASRFVFEFQAAQNVAESLGVTLSSSCVRLDEVHGSHCNILKDVLQLRSDGTASACFASSICSGGSGEQFTIGAYNRATGQFDLDVNRIGRFRARATEIHETCAHCENAYHCVRSCPDACLLSRDSTYVTSDFYCPAARQMAKTWLLKALTGRRAGQQDKTRSEIEDFLHCGHERIDVGSVVRNWMSMDPISHDTHLLPVPLWTRRPFHFGSAEAWNEITANLRSGVATKPLSVYVHIPFCRSHCGFCDCYSEPVGQNGRIHAFVSTLIEEAEAWEQQGLGPPAVTTVHFGGGTPSILPLPELERVVKAIKNTVPVTDATEWAMESTANLLTDEYLDGLKNLRFTRLHVGIQTLEEDVRRAIGRKTGSSMIEDRLQAALVRGFIVSVDLIYGLPGQTFGGWLATLDRLMVAGVDGFSLYNLQRTDRNQRFLTHMRDQSLGPASRFALLHAAHQVLYQKGFTKNHFAHFANSRDQNLYYRYAVRGENLLALGPSADGILDGFLYRHPELKEYFKGTGQRRVCLQGGLWMTPLESKLRPAEAELMANTIRWNTFEGLGLGEKLNEWRAMGFLDPCGRAGLSVTGSWRIARMVEAIAEAFV